MEFERVGVIGCGLMGSGIAEVCARAGCEVTVVEVDEAAVRRGDQKIRRSFERAQRSGKISSDEAEAALARLRFSTELGDLADRELVIEAAVESEAVKIDVFRKLDSIVSSPDAVLASNTSSIPIMKLGAATSRPAQVCGLHFFNPVPIMHLVELITSLQTRSETVRRCEEFAGTALGKTVIRSQDRAGFVVNALLVPYLLSAIRMLESGFATAEDIDRGMVDGCSHPMGPLALADLIGLDTIMAVARSMYDEFKEPLHAAPALLCRMVEAGLLGRKTGRGFYDYTR